LCRKKAIKGASNGQTAGIDQNKSPIEKDIKRAKND
jgi:hypothetical protein